MLTQTQMALISTVLCWLHSVGWSSAAPCCWEKAAPSSPQNYISMSFHTQGQEEGLRSFRSVKIQMQQIHVNMYYIYLTSDLSVCKRHSTGACFLITYDSLEIPNQGPSKGSHENTKGSWDYYML